jgi:hypothetical protein
METKYLDFENERWQKGYELFHISKANFKKNIGRKICYLMSRDMDRHRGSFIVRYGTILDIKYSQLIFDTHDSVDIRDMLECGIKIQSS